MDERILNRALVNYRENLKIQIDLEDKLEELETSLYGLGCKGVIKLSNGPQVNRSMVLTIKIMLTDQIRDQLLQIKKEIHLVNEFLKLLEGFEHDIINRKYILGSDYSELYTFFGYSRTQFYRLTERIIQKHSVLIFYKK